MKPCTDLRVFIFEGREFKRVRETDRQLETETDRQTHRDGDRDRECMCY